MVPKNDQVRSSKDPQDSEWDRKGSEGLTPGKIILDDDTDGKFAPSMQ